MSVLIATLVILGSIFQGIFATTFWTPVSSTDGALITFEVSASDVTNSTLSWVLEGEYVANATVTVKNEMISISDVSVASEQVYSATFSVDEFCPEVISTIALKHTPQSDGQRIMITDGTTQSSIQNVSTSGNSRNNYSVTVFTGSVRDASTNAWITLNIFGEFGNTGPIYLDDPSKNNFENSQQDLFNLSSFNVGRIKMLELGSDNGGQYPEWYLDKVIISDELYREAHTFTCFGWLAAGDGYSLKRRLYPGKNCSLNATAPCEVPAFDQLMCSGSDAFRGNATEISRQCYRLSSNKCTDTLSCENGTCFNGTTCDGSWKSHQCSRKCVIRRPGCDFMCEEECDESSDYPVNECEEGLHECDKNAGCIDTKESYNCSCNDGYTGTGKTCIDFDECADKSHNCDKHAKCTNKPGSFSCTCNEGYKGDGTECSGFIVTKANAILVSAIVVILTAFLG